MPRPIQEPDLVQGIRESFSIQGPQEFELDELVSPVAVVRDLTRGPQETLYGGAISGIAPSAGNMAAALLMNGAIGADPRIFVRVLSFFVRTPAVRQLEVQLRGFDGTPIVGSFAGRPLAPRADRQGRSQARVSADDNAGAGDRFAVYRTRSNTEGLFLRFPAPGVVLGVGRSLKLRVNWADEPISEAGFYWTEFRQAR